MNAHMSMLKAVRTCALAALALAYGPWANGADLRTVGEVIDDYVREALRSNLSLQAESLEVERNIAALDAARSGAARMAGRTRKSS